MEIIKGTKYFGEVKLTVNQYGIFEGIDTTLNGQNINIGINCKKNEDLEKNLPLFWEVVDKYIEINEIAINAVIEYYDFPLDELDEDNDEDWVGLPEGIWSVKYFFEELFLNYFKEDNIKVFGTDDFEKFNIKTFVGKILYPGFAVVDMKYRM